MTRFQIKRYEREAVVFDTASGDTHYLTPLAFALFMTSRDHPGMTPGEIAAALASRLALEPNTNFSDLAHEALASLQQIGLLQTP